MSLSQDLRAAATQLARKPLANGALGIGSSIALFSLVDAVLLRPLPYKDADRLVAVWDSTPEAGHPRSCVSGFEYLRWREEAQTLDAALMEELAVDKRSGLFVNHDFAGYEVPVHADIPHQEVIFLEETDPIASPMKAKGVGELGICGVGAAIANAVYNATGVRVRDYPITLDKLLDGLPEVG
jgi:hypothetical protein